MIGCKSTSGLLPPSLLASFTVSSSNLGPPSDSIAVSVFVDILVEFDKYWDS